MSYARKESKKINPSWICRALAVSNYIINKRRKYTRTSRVTLLDLFTRSVLCCLFARLVRPRVVVDVDLRLFLSNSCQSSVLFCRVEEQYPRPKLCTPVCLFVVALHYRVVLQFGFIDATSHKRRRCNEPQACLNCDRETSPTESRRCSLSHHEQQQWTRRVGWGRKSV